MALTEWTVTKRVVIVLTTLRVTRPVDTARRPVKHHSSLLSATHVRTNKLSALIVDFSGYPLLQILLHRFLNLLVTCLSFNLLELTLSICEF